MRKVEYKDREESINAVHLALRAVGFNVDYQLSDLIKSTIDAVNESGLELTIQDVAKIQVANERKWDKYFEEKGDVV